MDRMNSAPGPQKPGRPIGGADRECAGKTQQVFLRWQKTGYCRQKLDISCAQSFHTVKREQDNDRKHCRAKHVQDPFRSSPPGTQSQTQQESGDSNSIVDPPFPEVRERGDPHKKDQYNGSRICIHKIPSSPSII